MFSTQKISIDSRIYFWTFHPNSFQFSDLHFYWMLIVLVFYAKEYGLYIKNDNQLFYYALFVNFFDVINSLSKTLKALKLSFILFVNWNFYRKYLNNMGRHWKGAGLIKTKMLKISAHEIFLKVSKYVDEKNYWKSPKK